MERIRDTNRKKRTVGAHPPRSGIVVRGKGTQQHHKTSKVPLIIAVILLFGLVASYFIFPSYKAGIDETFSVLTSEDPDLIREWVSQFGVWGPIVMLTAMVLQMFLFFVPNILLILICILSYGPVWGGLLAWAGVLLASTVGYFIGNKLSPMIVHRLVSTKTQQTIREYLRDYGMKAIFVFRLSSFSNDGLSLVAGLLNMQYRRFITATIMGITPLITILAIFGKEAKIEKGLLWVGLVLLLGLIIYVVVDRKRKGRHHTH